VDLSCVLKLSAALSDKYDTNKWLTPQGIISVTGTRFMNWTKGIGGGGAIDLVMHLNGLDFKAALSWLEERFSHIFINASGIKSIAKQHFRPPKLVPTRFKWRIDNIKLAQVTHYLVNVRHISTAVIRHLIDCKKLYADNRGNAVFLLLGKEKRIVGAELRGTTKVHWRGMAPGSKKSLGCFYVKNTNTTKVVLCESAIDAISCFSLHQNSIAISTSGATPNPAWLSTLIAKGYEVFCGFDSDEIGDAMAKKMINLHPSIKRLCPSKHDWNDVLRSKSNL
jgi:hypothetical protein